MKTPTRRFAAVLAAALVGAALATPTAAHAAPVLANDAETVAEQCQVDAATLGWGMKESFRAYIAGSIANGSWETGPGVSYVPPSLSDSGAVEPGTDLFEWSTGSGEMSSTLEGGTVSFTGNVFFSGHDGALSLNIGDPAIEFTDAETAYLLLHIGEAAAGEVVPQVRAAKIELAGAVESAGESLTVAGAPAILTAEGAEAFNGGFGNYVSGDEMDPIFLSATVSGCALGTVTADDAVEPTEVVAPAQTDETAPVQAQPQEFPWLPVIIGGIALVVVVVAAILLWVGRPKKPAVAEATDGQDQHSA